MRKPKIELTDVEYSRLEHGFREGDNHCFRMRCHMVMLRSKGYSSRSVADVTGMTPQSVNNWVRRFLSEGIDGLRTRSGRGRKPIMDTSDEVAVRKAIADDRQRVSKAREAWQRATGKTASECTFKRFLSALAQDLDV